MSIIRIKYIISFILLSFLLMACNTTTYISGNIAGGENEGLKIYLIQTENLQEVAASYFGKVIDSTLVNSDGYFEFTNVPKTKEPVLLELAFQQSGKLPNYLQTDNPKTSNYMPIVWEPGETLKVSARWDAFQQSFSMENPSEINKALLNLRDINLQAYQTFIEGKDWKVEEGNQLMDKEHAILQYQAALIKFADSTPYLMPALVALRWVSPENNYERVAEFLVGQCHKWNNKEPEHPWVKQLCKQSEPANLPVLIGDVFPNLKLPLITKDTLVINDALGKKLTIIDLWASWCGPCRIENREILVPIWNDYHNKGLQIIAYGLESNETAWKAAVERDGASRWLQASDLEGDDTPFLKKIRISTIPANFILDAKGLVIAKNVHGKALSDWVQEYMQKE